MATIDYQSADPSDLQTKPTMGAAEWSLLLFLALLWGGSFFFQKKVLRELGPYTMVFGRLGLAALALNLVVLLMGFRLSALRRHWPGMILMAAFNNAIPFCLFGWSQTRIASGLAAIFNATAPLFTVIAAHLFTKDERLTPRKAIGVISGLTGVIFIIGPDVLRGPRGSVLGQLACLLAAICYSLCAIYSRRFKGIPPILLAGVQLAIAALLVFPVALVVEHPWKLSLPGPTTWSALFALGLLSTAFAYAIWFRLLASAGATNTVLVTFLIPITALLLGALFLSEKIQPRALGGFACIILGLAIIDGRIVQFLRSKLAPKPEEVHA
jgi:drug/metabolite transporter (DMT)-like permease